MDPVFFEICKTIGAIGFVISPIPLAYGAWRSKDARGVDSAFFWIWAIAEIAMIIGTAPLWQWQLTLTYALNLICLVIIGYYKYFPDLGNEKKCDKSG